jgi:hypothetical protein
MDRLVPAGRSIERATKVREVLSGICPFATHDDPPIRLWEEVDRPWEHSDGGGSHVSPNFDQPNPRQSRGTPEFLTIRLSQSLADSPHPNVNGLSCP